MSKKRLAILSPSQNAYSETFIQAHKELIDATIYYYYGNSIPFYLEGKGNLNPIYKKAINKLIGYQKNDAEWDIKQALKKSLKENKIEVVLAEYGTTAARVLPICIELNLPLIVHFHGYDATVYDVLKQHNNYKELFAYAKYIIAVSKAMFEQLINIGCPKEKLILNTYGPNDDFLKLTPTLEIEQFIAIGRFTDKKAPYYTILAFKQVVDQNTNAKLIMAGDGHLLNTCKNLVKLYQLEKNVTFVGVITPNEFREYLKNCRAFVQHSITAENGDMEGTPLAVLEASAASIPVISTNHAGIPDVVINNETGYLVDEHDVNTMATKMIDLLNDKEKASKMGKTAKQRIQDHFSMQKHIDTLNILIQKTN